MHQALQVSQTPGPLFIPRRACQTADRVNGTCRLQHSQAEFCDGFQVAESLLEPAFICEFGQQCRYEQPTVIAADLLVMVTSLNFNCGANAAQASVCARNDYGRPYAGWINVCPDVRTTIGIQQADLSRLVLHELIHVAGFEGQSFPLFRSCDEGHITPHFSCIQRPAPIQTVSGKLFLTLPTARAMYQQHTGCLVTGVPLESAVSTARVHHWDGLALNEEVMAPRWVVLQGRRRHLSNMTLAALHDSSWYRANFSSAEPYLWAKNTGCTMAGGTNAGNCHPVVKANERFVCGVEQLSRRTCAYDDLYLAVCSLDGLTDACPFWQTSDTSCASATGLRGHGVSYCARNTTRFNLPQCSVHRCFGGLQYVWSNEWLECNASTHLAAGSLTCSNSTCPTIQSGKIATRNRLHLQYFAPMRFQNDFGPIQSIDWLQSLSVRLRQAFGLCDDQLLAYLASYTGPGLISVSVEILELEGCRPVVDVVAGLATRLNVPDVEVMGYGASRFRRLLGAPSEYKVESRVDGGVLLLMVLIIGLLATTGSVVGLLVVSSFSKQTNWTRPTIILDSSASGRNDDSRASLAQSTASKTPRELMSWADVLETPISTTRGSEAGRQSQSSSPSTPSSPLTAARSRYSSSASSRRQSGQLPFVVREGWAAV
eukprot:TRINITY_DN11312_c0_g2_i1.p1 TRINITY_DN11312_c0_g2~~TRINITY_DN11312_c0_g2_i1.p1  ORF type:complete len:703 (+),score=45.97 TRINITY_DN11312_c0_g2_i1:144-2111(+)